MRNYYFLFAVITILILYFFSCEKWEFIEVPASLWSKSYGGSDGDRVSSITSSQDGGYVVAGRSVSSNYDVPGNNGSWDYWILKLDASGDKVWSKTYGGSDYDYAVSIISSRDGGYVVAGESRSSDYDVPGNNGRADYWILKIPDQYTYDTKNN